MSLNKFETALPDTMTIEDAVRVMIEGDDRIKLPLCYETVALPFFDCLVECCRIMERSYESALEFGTRESQEIARQQLDTIETIQRNAQLYREDLNNLADRNESGFSPDDNPPEAAGLKSEHRLLKRAFLVPWAYNSPHGVDINGFHARQVQPGNDTVQPVHGGLSIPERPKPTEGGLQDSTQKNTPSQEDLRRAVLGEMVHYTDGQWLFLSLAWLVDELITAKNRNWRGIVSDETDETTMGFIIKGRLNNAQIAQSIADQLPVRQDAADPTRTIKDHIKLVAGFMAAPPDHVLELSSKQMPKAYRTLYGLARATWKAKEGKFLPDRQTVEYPAEMMDKLVEELADAQPLPTQELEGCLQEALLTTQRLHTA